MNTKLFAVTGNPVLHSLSPVLMSVSDSFNYFRLCAETAEEAIKTFKQLDFKGLNVTAPFKKDVIKYLDCLSENAKKAEAVNCIFYSSDNKLCGDNTDIKGVELTLKLYPEFLQQKKMLVIGSGGATPAVIIAGKNLGLEVTVTARNINALEALKERFNINIKELKNIENFINDFAVIVQALPSGVKVFEPESLTKDHVVLDANYKDSIFETPAKKIGFKFLSGKNWLVNQAVPSYENFTGEKIAPEKMYEALKNYKFDFQGRIALTGFMGVGKTTSGKELAKLTGYKFIDSDDEIEKNEGMKISEIFSKKGEDYFRKIETEFLKTLSKEKNIILSCGGGTVKNEENRKILRENFLNLWLYAPVEYCLDGLDISNRPLLQCENPVEKAREMFLSRVPFYADAAYAVVNVENLNREKIAEKIYGQISKTFKI
jgi:shikimate dehydrogenase